MSLVKELIRPLLEEEKKVVAVYGGGFELNFTSTLIGKYCL